MTKFCTQLPDNQVPVQSILSNHIHSSENDVSRLRYSHTSNVLQWVREKPPVPLCGDLRHPGFSVVLDLLCSDGNLSTRCELSFTHFVSLSLSDGLVHGWFPTLRRYRQSGWSCGCYALTQEPTQTAVLFPLFLIKPQNKEGKTNGPRTDS